MKKLMIATLGLAVAGSVFGTPVVYDYKATVKHTYLKEAKVKISNSSETLYLKKAKSSSLKGYLIQDVDTQTKKAAGDVQPKNRCYLVVLNRSAEKDYRYVRILPGIIDASWYSSKDISDKKKVSVAAQGYLYLGGDMTDTLAGATLTGTASTLSYIEGKIGADDVQRDFIESVQSREKLKFGIDDYFFTSCYLFGQYNQPDWNFVNDATEGPGASSVQYRWFFADAWLNGAGLGKASYSSESCCGLTDADYVLDSLTGNLKAGLYLCGLSGSDVDHDYLYVFGEQIWAENWEDASSRVPHANQADTWADGGLDLGTTDVGYGTWSIKRNAKFAGVSIEDKELPSGGDWSGTFNASVYPFIKAAAQKLDKNVDLFGNPIEGALINEEFHNTYLDKQ